MSLDNMEKGLLWITALVTSILTIRGQTSNVTYMVCTNRTTWKDAASACNQLNGTLIDSSEYIENASNKTLSENNSYWTSSFSFLTEWVELKGCFYIQNSTAVCIQHNDNSVDIGWSCYAYCENYTYFGIIDDVCVCFSETPSNISIPSFNNCPSCSNSSSFQCGVDGYTALYKIRKDFNKTEMCASYNCQGNGKNAYSFGFTGQSCKGLLKVQCNDGHVSSKLTSWFEARQVCEKRNSFILRHPLAECKTKPHKSNPSWDNIHRNNASFTTGFELRSGIRLHNRQLLKCSLITPGNDKPDYDRCNSSKNGYICKIEHSPDVYSPAICTINQTEPDVSTIPPTRTTTGEPTSRDTLPSNMLYIAIGAGVGGFILIVLIVIIICTCRKRSNRKRATEKESKDRHDIDLDGGQVNHMEAAERYVSMKSEQSIVRYKDIGKNGGDCYEQIVLPDEEPSEGFPKVHGIVCNGDKKQRNNDVPETSNVVEDNKTEDHYAELDSESHPKEKIRIQPETNTVKINDQKEGEDDYDHFGQANIRSSVSSNYDHVHLRNSITTKKEHADDTEDYDHIPGAAGRRNEAEVDSTYDHAQNFELRDSASSNYDHVVLLGDQEHSDANRVSDDYDHTTNVSKVGTEDENRGSNYTQVTLPDPT
ncbi:uncharacterized protein LOC117321984 isoform X2 [Pecten maximus]|uniref:uncharacterized protein LOC117321984 isoform X2 n=1 Tax=Pecten maximus TaxID=6579 RepID=UPI001458BD5E|nr:uncharacterized protein LOC117321984 isoform X2 [Pecten maximus]